MKTRHDLDIKLFDFVTNMFNKNFNNDHSLYTSQVGCVEVKIWKHQFHKLEKVEIFINNIKDEKGESSNLFTEQMYRFDFDKSNELKNFFEGLEDSKQQDHLRNHQKDIEDIIKKVEF